MATGEEVGQHPGSSPNGVQLQRRNVARQVEQTAGQVTPSQPDGARENDSRAVPSPLVARLEALEARALLARIESLEAQAAGVSWGHDAPRVPTAASIESRTAHQLRNRSHDEASQLRLQIAGLTMQVAEFEEQTKEVRHGSRRRKSSKWRLWPGRRH